MKRFLSLFLILAVFCLTAAGCEDGTQEGSGLSSDNSSSESLAEDSGSSSTPKTDGVDVDLTVLGSNMVYAEVFSMMMEPEDYVGKTIKARGPYASNYYEALDQYYHFVIIEDATACCQEGLEFIWSGEHTYPNDYPEEFQQVEITGVFSSYVENGMNFYYLAVDGITIVE